MLCYGDKVAQLVRCRIGNQRVAGSNPGRLGHFGLFLGNIVNPILLQSTQLYNGYLAYIRQCLECVRYMLPVALEYPLGD